VHFSAGENETRMTAHADRLMREIWVEAGAQDIWAYPRFAHVIGACRMGADPRPRSWIRTARASTRPGLFVADNSTFPSALSANPSLTIMALSLRTADRFIARARRGDA
jgi:choline dehydrogenase-like flavoprotein